MKTFIALSLLLAPCLGVFQASLQIEEAGVRYNQTEIFDPLTSDVITLVPSHHRDGIYLHQLAKVENEDLGLVVWKLADKEVCHIEDMDAEDHPLRFLLQVASLEARNVTVDASMIRMEYVH